MLFLLVLYFGSHSLHLYLLGVIITHDVLLSKIVFFFMKLDLLFHSELILQSSLDGDIGGMLFFAILVLLFEEGIGV